MKAKPITTRQAIDLITRNWLHEIRQNRHRTAAFLQKDPQGWQYVTIYNASINKVLTVALSPESETRCLEFPPLEDIQRINSQTLNAVAI